MTSAVRMSEMPFVGSPWPTLTLVAAYLAFVFKIGPEFMKDRKPYNIKTILLIYNFLQIVTNFYFGFETLYIFITMRPYDPGCMMQAGPDNPLHVHEVRLVHAYFMLKLLDLCDTIFFVVRKNFKQVSFLHVYHHVLMVLFVFWLCWSGNYGGHFSSIGMVNLWVHGFMYSYYFISALSERVKQALWWKKYITVMQMAQFVFLLGHQMWPLLFRPDCQFSQKLLWSGVVQCLVMLVLFTNFYIQTYAKKRGSDTKSAKNDKTNGVVKECSD